MHRRGGIDSGTIGIPEKRSETRRAFGTYARSIYSMYIPIAVAAHRYVIVGMRGG